MDRSNKKNRLETIRKIVSKNGLGSQEELLAALRAEGFVTTQTTLSRDLKLLRISKVRVKNGHSVYALPHETNFDPAPTLEEINMSKWKIRFSGNLMVLHTPPGHAGMVAYDLDNIRNPYFIGTVAGDDTVFGVLAEDVDKEDVIMFVREIFPELN